jgi:UDP-GlcNAc:undecaprenyl-phosphate GlcNAc-1-phosphate transferase
MLALGHSHRRAVVILYVWTAVFAFSAAALVQWDWEIVLIWTTVFVVLALLATLGPLRHRGRFLDDDVAALSGQTPRVPATVGAGVAEPRVAPQGARPSAAHLSSAPKTKETIE